MRKLLVVGTLLCLGVLLAGTASAAPPAAVQRPIDDFVAAQGTYCWPDGNDGCLLFVPPIENFLGWCDPMANICASVDYAGLADDYASGAFGTVTSGSVTERPLADGRAEVEVRLHTKNALTWVVDGYDFQNGELLFGHRAPDVLDGKDAALGDSLLHVKYINTAPGAPLPDLIQIAYAPEPGQEVTYLAFNARASGTLPDGSPARATVVQTGLFMTGFHGAVADGFPVEFIKTQNVGQ